MWRSGPLTAPVLFLIFRRPDTTARVFEAIRAAKPTRLFVSADGPRGGRPEEAERCRMARELATAVDWDCELRTNFRPDNVGCKLAVSGGIRWFFDHVDEGIILEDDCLPSQSFFWFCQDLLHRYRDDERVMQISGANFQFGRTYGDGSYYFSKLNDVWGWATWRRAWAHCDLTMASFPAFKGAGEISNYLDEREMADWLMSYFEEAFAGPSNVWSSQWSYAMCVHNGLTIVPNVNLVANIGFGRPDAAHGSGATWAVYANVPTQEVEDLVHPPFVLPSKAADAFRFQIIRRTDPRLCRSRVARAVAALQRLVWRRLPLGWRRRVKQLVRRGEPETMPV